LLAIANTYSFGSSSFLAVKHNVQEHQALKTLQPAHLGNGSANMNQSVAKMYK